MPPKSKSQINNVYSAENIKNLDPREHIRLRPGMYIGGTDSRALHHMIYEVLDSAVEEVMVGKCNRITITLRANNTVTVEDNSSGLSVENTPHPNYEVGEVPYFELMMTSITFKSTYQGQFYGRYGGLHGFGFMIVNALSCNCSLQVRRDGFLWEQTYEKGIPVASVQRVRQLRVDEASGNTITFQPDFTIFDKNDFDFQTVAKRCKELAYLFPAATISVRDLRGEYLEEETHYWQIGLADLVRELNKNKLPIHPIIYTRYIEQVLDRNRNNTPIDIGVSLAFQFCDEVGMTIESFINSVPMSNYGIHTESFLKSVIEVIKNATNTNFRIGQRRMGFTGTIHIQHPAPDFRSPTKVNLRNPELPAIVMNAVQQAIHEHPEAFAILVQYVAGS